MQAWEQALELRTETFGWWLSPMGRSFSRHWTRRRNPKGMIASTPEIAGIEAAKLSLADPFYVTREMCDLLAHAAKGIPDSLLRPEDLPAPAGFVLLADAMETIDVREKILPWRAFAWMLAGHEDNPEEATGIHLSLYSHRDQDDERLEVEDSFKRDIVFPTLGLLHETAWTFDDHYSDRSLWTRGIIDRHGQEISEAAFLSGIEMMRTVHTFFVLCGQRIGEPQSTQASRAIRKRAARVMPRFREIPNVRVVTLRRYRDDDKDIDPESRGREYSHRWIRNGFWRRQPYGPGRKYHRPVYIAPHVCGPKDKPLVLKDTAYIWRR